MAQPSRACKDHVTRSAQSSGAGCCGMQSQAGRPPIGRRGSSRSRSIPPPSALPVQRAGQGHRRGSRPRSSEPRSAQPRVFRASRCVSARRPPGWPPSPARSPAPWRGSAPARTTGHRERDQPPRRRRGDQRTSPPPAPVRHAARAMGEGVGKRAAQCLEPREKAKDREDPRPEGPLLRAAGCRIRAGDERWRQHHPNIARILEGVLQRLLVGGVGIEASHLVLVLVGHHAEPSPAFEARHAVEGARQLAQQAIGPRDRIGRGDEEEISANVSSTSALRSASRVRRYGFEGVLRQNVPRSVLAPREEAISRTGRSACPIALVDHVGRSPREPGRCGDEMTRRWWLQRHPNIARIARKCFERRPRKREPAGHEADRARTQKSM